MRIENDFGRFGWFRILVLGAIARIVLATGCIEGEAEPQPEADLLSEPDGIVVADSTNDLGIQTPPDLSPRWLPESLLPFRLPLEALSDRHRPSPWPARPEAISAVLSRSNWDSVRPSVLSLYRALGYRPAFLGSAEGRGHALRLFSWLVASTELGMDPIHTGTIRLLELTAGACAVEAATQLGSVAHDELLASFAPNAPPTPFALVCQKEWIPADRELEMDVRLVAGFFMAWESLSTSFDNAPIRWVGPQSTLPTLLEMLPGDQHYWFRVAALRRWSHPALEWSTDTKGKWVRLKPGMSGPRVEELHRRLVEQGYLGQLPAGRALRAFGEETAVAVRRFRLAHGLPAKEAVDDAMVELLSMRREHEAAFVWQSLRATLASGRHRESDYLLANLADFRLLWIKGGRIEALYRLAAGMPLKAGGGATQEVDAFVTGLTLNPEWYPSLAVWKQEVLPRARRNDGYLAEQGFEKRGTRWIQSSGPANRLGSVLLALDCETAAAMHGSPDPKAFQRAFRAITSGEIWVEGIEDLAARLMAQTGTSLSQPVAEALTSQTPQVVAFAVPVPIHVVYDRVRVEQDGQVSIVGDPYREARLPGKVEVKGLRSMTRRIKH